MTNKQVKHSNMFSFSSQLTHANSTDKTRCVEQDSISHSQRWKNQSNAKVLFWKSIRQTVYSRAQQMYYVL